MKSKLSWIPFIPLFLAACFLKLAQGLFDEGTVMGLNSLKLDYLYMAAVVLIFLFTMVFCLLDKKIAAYYLPHRNIPDGIIGLALALLLAADGANSIFRIISAGSLDVLNILGAVFSLLSAIVFIVLGLNHSFRNKESKNLSLFYAMPALLCAVRMILSFVTFTTISIRLADVSRLVCYVFATMFFFYYAVALSLIKTKKALKYCIIFGLPAAAALIPYGIYHLAFTFDSEVIMNDIQPLEMLLFGLYILFFVIELTAFVRDKDSVSIIEEEEKVEVNPEEKVDGFFANTMKEDENDSDSDDSSLHSRDTEGFLYQETPNLDDYPDLNEAAKKDAENYLTEVQEDLSEEQDNRPKNYEDRLDEIDKLILDITSKSD